MRIVFEGYWMTADGAMNLLNSMSPASAERSAPLS
jgi:hypothetical protein